MLIYMVFMYIDPHMTNVNAISVVYIMSEFESEFLFNYLAYSFS